MKDDDVVGGGGNAMVQHWDQFIAVAVAVAVVKWVKILYSRCIARTSTKLDVSHESPTSRIQSWWQLKK